MDITPTREQAVAALAGLEKTIKAAGADNLSKISECCAAFVLKKADDRKAFNESYFIAANYMAQHPKEYLSMQIAQRLGSATYLAVIANCPADLWEKMPKSTALKVWTKSWVGKGDPLIDLALSADILVEAITQLSNNFVFADKPASAEAKHKVQTLVAQLAGEGSPDGAQLHSMLQTFDNQNIIVDFARLLVFYQAFQRHLKEGSLKLETRQDRIAIINNINITGEALVGACANLITLYGIRGTSGAMEGHERAKKQVNAAINEWARVYSFRAPVQPMVWPPEVVKGDEQKVDSCIRELKLATDSEDAIAIEKASTALRDALSLLHIRRSGLAEFQTIDNVAEAKQRANDVLTGDLRSFLKAELALAVWLQFKVTTQEAKHQCAKQALVVEYNIAVLDKDKAAQAAVSVQLKPYDLKPKEGEFIIIKEKDVNSLIDNFSSSFANELKSNLKIK